MDRAKILRLLNEADDIVSALYRQGANKDYKCKTLHEKLNAIGTEIDTLDTETEPVRHGRWINTHFVSGGDFNRCSECGCYVEKTYFANDYNVRYCPACGAKMDA